MESSSAWKRRASEVLHSLLWVIALLGSAQIAHTQSISLDQGWKLQSSCIVKATGGRISLPEYHPEHWIDAVVPGTVLGSQVADRVFPDPYFGMNLRAIPGTDYPMQKIFGYLPMSKKSPYRCPWWYRIEIPADKVQRSSGQATWLHFDGINYRANIWLNGTRIASSDKIAGAFRAYDFDISKWTRRDQQNVLAVEVSAQTENDLGIDFLDWNPSPADKSMGLWRGVSLTHSGPVTLRNPAVFTHFTSDDLHQADLQFVVDVANHADHSVRVKLKLALGKLRMEHSISLAANESRSLRLSPDDLPELRIKNPELWWPYQYGEPHLEEARVAAFVDDRESDVKSTRFGIREVRSFLNEQGHLQFQINRQNILIRGGGWTPDLLYREPQKRLLEELEYAKQMHLNAIRLEGKLGSEDLFDLADELGILVLAGWQCCDFWQHWDKWTQDEVQIADASLLSQINHLRSHPSLLAWMNGSDETPPTKIEAGFLSVLKERDWPNAIMSSAADRTSSITGPTGVKMTGPYDYVPPEYWYLDKSKYGGAYGFNTETSPGPAIPLASSIRRTLPEKSWWPIDEQWKYHAGLGKFAQYDRFDNAMSATYTQPDDLARYSLTAQLMAYDSERAMFEAYGANKYQSTGVIQWMLNNAWPSFIWHLYDYYLVPGGGFFGARKANEPLHVLYRYDNRNVDLVNSTLHRYTGLRAIATVFNLSSKQLWRSSAAVDLDSDGVATAITIPEQSTTTFLKLELRDAEGKLLTDNFYWLPAKLADLEWNKTTYFYTPASRYADMRDLAAIPKSTVSTTAAPETHSGYVAVRLRNTGNSLAFFLHLRAVKGNSDEDIAALDFSDNFISLLPGESKEIAIHKLPAGPVDIKLEGWNVATQTLHLTRNTAEENKAQ